MREHSFVWPWCLGILLCSCTQTPPQKSDVHAEKPQKTNKETALLTSVRIQLNWVPEPQFGGIFAAKEAGDFKKAGLKVTIIKGSAGVPSPQLTAEGRVEFGVVGGDQLVSLRAKGAPLVAVYASFQQFPRAVVVHESSPYKDLRSLWGSESTVGVEPGLPYVRWLNKLYGGQNLKLVPSQGGLAGFMNDPLRAQGVFIFAEPVELAQRQIKTKTFPVAESGYNPYTAVVATNEEYLGAQPETVKAFVGALRAGWTRYLEDPRPANEAMAKLNSAMSLEAMEISAQLAAPYVRNADGPIGAMTKARWQRLGENLLSLGVIKNIPPASRCFAQNL